jgi:hypothetical protein
VKVLNDSLELSGALFLYRREGCEVTIMCCVVNWNKIDSFINFSGTVSGPTQ